MALGRVAVQVVSLPLTVILESEQISLSAALLVVKVIVPLPLSEVALGEMESAGCSCLV